MQARPWLLRHVLPSRRLELTPAGWLLLAYLVTAVVALVVGTAYARPSLRFLVGYNF